VDRGFQELPRLRIGTRIILRRQQLTTCGHSSANNLTTLVYCSLPELACRPPTKTNEKLLMHIALGAKKNIFFSNFNNQQN